jgi:threonine dehydratase
MPDTSSAATIHTQQVEDARQRIGAHVHKTPCVLSEPLSQLSGCQLFLKMENQQRTGSFKERGALNKLLDLDAEARARGVITASAGNHAQGVAYHARRLGIAATICMPLSTPLIKVQRTQGMGAKVVLHGEGFDEAQAHARALEQEQGLVYVHPFDDPLVIAGQGTIALEIMKQNPLIDAFVVPVGGGGLIAGMAMVLKETNPRIKIYGVETEAMPGMRASLAAGEVVTVPAVRTLADGIAVARVGALPFSLCRRFVDDIVTVSDEETASAILKLLEEEKTIVEAAAAVTVAAILNHHIPQLAGKKVCAVISGGNIDVNVIGRLIERGLAQDGRLMRVSVNLSDLPGSLARLTALIANLRANILECHHNRTFSLAPFGGATVELTLETRGPDHQRLLHAALLEHGYAVVNCIPQP